MVLSLALIILIVGIVLMVYNRDLSASTWILLAIAVQIILGGVGLG